MYMYGGSTALGNVSSQLWRVSISNDIFGNSSANTSSYSGCNLNWENLNTTGDIPSPLCYHNMATVNNSSMLILFGGCAYNKRCTVITNDMYVLNISTLHWTKLNITLKPSARYGAGATIINNTFFVIGGRVTNTGQGASDFWSIDLAPLLKSNFTGNLTWTILNTISENNTISDSALLAMGTSFNSVCTLTIAGIGDVLVIIGGVFTITFLSTAPPMYYDPNTAKWGILSSTSTLTQLYGAAIATTSSMDIVYMYGGHTLLNLASTLFSYEAHFPNWNSIVQNIYPPLSLYPSYGFNSAIGFYLNGGLPYTVTNILPGSWVYSASVFSYLLSTDVGESGYCCGCTLEVQHVVYSFAFHFTDNINILIGITVIDGTRMHLASFPGDARLFPACTFSVINGNAKIIIFGGSSVLEIESPTMQGILNDTWVYDVKGNFWSNKTVQPSNFFGRVQGVLNVFDTAPAVAYLFGGLSPVRDNSIWKLDVASMQWSNVQMLTNPIRGRISFLSSAEGSHLFITGGIPTDFISENDIFFEVFFALDHIGNNILADFWDVTCIGNAINFLLVSNASLPMARGLMGW